MNANFGKVENGKMTHAPDVVRVDGHDAISPTAEQYARADGGPYLPNENTPQEPKEGFCAASYEWKSDGIKNYKEWRYEPIPPPPPKVYNKYRLGMAIQEAGLLDALLQFFAANPAAKFHWDNAQEFEENDENFVEICNQFVDSFGADTVSAILAKAEVVNA